MQSPTEPQPDVIPGNPPSHYQPLVDAIPDWLGQASATRRTALKNNRRPVTDSIRKASAAQHDQLRAAIAGHMQVQNSVDQRLAQVQDVSAYAEPLLKAVLKSRFGLELDVKEIFLRLYLPASTPIFGIRTGVRSWTVSLLDAALHNFQKDEARQDAYDRDSGFITRPSQTGQFETLPQIREKISIPAFISLCRELDIGAGYKTYLEDCLGISNPVVAALLPDRLKESQKTALKADLQLARVNGDIGENWLRLINGMLDGIEGMRINGHTLRCQDLTMMSASLTGIVVFAADLEQARVALGVVAYIPGDPEHPIKEYASSAAMEKELVRQLRSPEYQHFFTQFVAHEQKGHFLADLNQRLSQVKWHEPVSGSQLPPWREAPIEKPKLQMAVSPITGNLWEHLYQRKLNKVLNDAATLAVPTADADRKARWALWDSFVDIASSILQIASFVVLPFVPFLGEMMMAYITYQFLDEAFEGIVDWAEGAITEAGEQLFSALESLVELGAFGIGGGIAMTELPKVLPPSVVSFIDRFRPVKLRNGKTLYWKPDLKPYESPIVPPERAVPDKQGLHWQQGKKLMPIEQKHYAVSDHIHPDKLQIEHPTRTDAYRPVAFHNGEGAFHTELERPLEWDTAAALQRVGPSIEPFSPARRERILKVSGCHEEALRKMHVDRERVPPLLADTIQRFKIDQDLQGFISRMASDRAEDYLHADPLMQLQLLNDQGLLPDNRRLRLIDGQGQILWQSSADEQLPLIDLHQDRLADGDLLKTLLQSLGERDINTLLAEEFGQMIALDVRTRRLRNRIAQIATSRRTALFEARYQALQHREEPLTKKVAGHEPHLPARITEELLHTATGTELLAIDAGEWPERQQSLAAQATHELRITRAYEGLELDSVRNPDTDTLALHSLKKLPGWSGDVRFEVRAGSPEGPLLDSTGAPSAAIQKVLVRRMDGTWQPFDHQGMELHAPTDFYTSVLQALPDAQRQALNLQIGEGAKLRQAIRDNPVDRGDLRLAIADEAIQPLVVDTLRLVGAQGYARETPQSPRTLENRIRQVYPGMADDDMQSMTLHLRNHPDGPLTELSRLQLEYAQLDSDLNNWALNVPRVDPATRLALSPIQKTAIQRDRQQFAHALRRCWRRETPEPSGFRLQFAEPLMGELPVLSANFDHVTNLDLKGTDSGGGIDRFLQGFTRLRRLALNQFDLDDLPQSITAMTSLRQLRLRHCGITLTPQNQLLLSSLNELTSLDLQGNPLGITMDVNALPTLHHLNLTDTGISELPHGLLAHPRIKSAWLADNRIAALPDAVFEFSPGTTAGYDFSGNPFSNATREQIKVYFKRTGNDMGVRAEQSDIDRTKALFTDLNDRLASELIYQLPGSLVQGRIQLARWETEIVRMTADLAAWVRDIPDRHPHNGELFSLEERLAEHTAREAFAGRLERLWRHRSTAHPLTRADVFTAQPTFVGDMPVVNADLNHITTLSMTGKKDISGVPAFLRTFPRLTHLILQDFALEGVSQALAQQHALTTLTLKNCGLVYTAETQAALATMPALELLELPDNPLGSTPDLSELGELTYLDLSNTDIAEVPVGMAGHPKLKTAIVSENRISEIPDVFFSLPARASEGFDFSANPLSAETREKIKTYSREYGPDFGVLADKTDIDATKALFPGLDDEDASEVFYGLPGDIEHGRSQLRHWQAEIEQLSSDLAHWINATPATHPVTGERMSPMQMFVEHTHRKAFAQQLERLWRARTTQAPRLRTDTLIMDVALIGDLPALSTNFSHITELSFSGNTALNGMDTFLDSFTGLRHLELHDFNFTQFPAACERMPALQRLIIENCALTLTPQTQASLSSLSRLQYLNLSRNPLGAPPSLSGMTALVHLRMVDTAITRLPDDLLDHPRLVAANLDKNLISELPDAVFNIPPQQPAQLSFTDNPLSEATLERIKVCYQLKRQNFGVFMPREDLDRTQSLFPTLDREDANRVLYLLPGTLEEGRAQIGNWEMEWQRLDEDLTSWVADIPERFPATGELISEDLRLAEQTDRETFRREIEAFWRERSEEQPEARSQTLNLNIPFVGDLPPIRADFSHVLSLSLNGNTQLRVNEHFLQCFSGLKGLELRDLALGQFPRAITGMPALEELVLSNCALVLDSEGQTALSALTRLTSLDLYRNPLGRSPNLRNMAALEYLDLASTGISELPEGLLELPAIETIVLNNNHITEIPQAVFELPASAGAGYDFGDNPLSAATREHVKNYYRRTEEDLGVLAEPADIARARTLYPTLDDEQASAFIYRLDGTLVDGRTELTRLELELETLRGDLVAWEADIPGHPVTGLPLNADQRLHEEQNRAAFSETLLTCWRQIPVEGANAADHQLTSTLSIMGELPTLRADFSHVSDLYLVNSADHWPRVGRFLEAFPGLEHVDIRGYDLSTVPEAIFRMNRLTTLSLPACRITLTAREVNGLAGLHSLELLHLQDNPLKLAPDLSNLQHLSDLDLSTTGISEIPRGVLGNHNWMEIDLSGNEIIEVPDELQDVPAYVGDRYDLRGNPFSPEAMNRIRAYYQETGHTLNVDNVVGQQAPVTRPGVAIED
ncbi:dermonecrotic toxin domain-containing protein [Pseudomonas gozinkensis]|uniref:dermonecrotic toxin domain-containing protein n=1 Tax=Pseudomonas gozinkensis TaxID=2774461 RepID=UPI0017889DB3|nr:DUF6543 domain-containing protein [Pseudomonas gozinkensis]